MMKWKNWSGNQTANPEEIRYPTSEQEVVDLVLQAKKRHKKIRVVGSGHSFSKLVPTNQILVSLDKMQGIIEADTDAQIAIVWGGTKLEALGKVLFEKGLAQENMGDINVQSIAGALSTGTHGTGAKWGTLSTQILELTLVNGRGEVVVINEDDPLLFGAARVSIGTLGIITRIKLKLEKAYKLHEITRKETLEDCLNNLDRYIQDNRNFEFFWFPHTDTVQTKFLNLTDKPPKLPAFGKKISDVVIEYHAFNTMSKVAKIFPRFTKTLSKLTAKGISNGNFINWSHDVYATARNVRFNEMEYNVPIEHFKTALLEIKEMISKEKINVHFPVECRFVKPDDIFISPAYQREAAYIAVHQFRGMPYEEYFCKSEAIFKKYNGRPHWGKLNFLEKEDFATLYPKWDDFCSVREKQDPDRIFLNDYLEQLF